MEREHVMVGCETLYAVEIRLESLEVYDARCEQRIGAYVASDGTPVVSVIDRRKHIALFVTTDEGYGQLIFTGSDGANCLSVHIAGDGRPDVRLCGKLAAIRSRIYIDDNRPGFILFEEDETARGLVYLAADGGPVVELCNADGEAQAELSGGSMLEVMLPYMRRT